MAESKQFSGEEFVKVLAENKHWEPVVLEGMAKPSEGDPNAFLFAPGVECAAWVRIPLEVVERVDLIRVVRCKDHTHPLVKVQLKEPPKGDEIAALFVGLVRQAARAGIARGQPQSEVGIQETPTVAGTCYGYSSGCPSHAPCAQQFGDKVYCTNCCIALGPAAPGLTSVSSSFRGAPFGGVSVTQQNAARYTYRMCFYERDGQYAGSSISDDLAALNRQCQNWIYLHGGSCSLC